MIIEKLTTRVKETSINVVQTTLESIRKKDIVKTGVRVYKDGLIGVAGTIGTIDDDILISEAIEALNNKISYPCEPCKNREEIVICKNELMEDDKLIDETNIILETLKKTQPNFSFFNKINLVEKEVTLENTSNLNLKYKDKYILAELVFKEKSSSNIMDGGVGIFGRKYNRECFLNHVNEICNAFNNKLDFDKNGKYPVIFSVLDGVPLKKLLQDLHGQIFATGSSLFSNKLGQKLFNENFTLYQSLSPEDGIEPFFDAEGVINENYRYPLIKNGVLLSPYTDKKTSTLFNLPLTGSALSDYDSVPSLALTGFSVKQSENTLKELLNGEMGIYIAIAAGGDFTPDGKFGTPVQLPLLFDGEKFVGRLPELQLSSNVFDMFGKDFRGVAKDSLNPLSLDKFMVIDLEVSKI